MAVWSIEGSIVPESQAQNKEWLKIGLRGGKSRCWRQSNCGYGTKLHLEKQFSWWVSRARQKESGSQTTILTNRKKAKPTGAWPRLPKKFLPIPFQSLPITCRVRQCAWSTTCTGKLTGLMLDYTLDPRSEAKSQKLMLVHAWPAWGQAYRAKSSSGNSYLEVLGKSYYDIEETQAGSRKSFRGKENYSISINSQLTAVRY